MTRMQRMLAATRSATWLSATDELRVIAKDQRIHFTPRARRETRDVLTARWTVLPVLPGGYMTIHAAESMTGSRLWPNWPDAGMAPVVQQLLLDRGIRCPTTYHCANEHELLAVDWQRGPGHPPIDEMYLRLLGVPRNWLIRYAPGHVDTAWLIAQVALTYPDAHIAVVTSTRETANRFGRRLRRWVGDVEVTSREYPSSRPSKMLVGTIGGLAHHAQAIRCYDFVIFCDAMTGLQDGVTALPLATDTGFRLLGFLPSAAGLSPYERDRLTAMYGPVDYTILRHGHGSIVVDVMWMPLRSPRVGATATPQQLRKAGYARHHARNRRIAALAIAIREGAIDEAERLCPRVGQRLRTGEPQRILVVTESVNHALALARALNGWPIRTRHPVLAQGLDAASRQLLAERSSQTSNRTLIATASALAEIDLTEVDVVVWAGGGPSRAPLDPTKLLVPWAAIRRLLLIDIQDHHHPRLRAWSRQRRTEYDQMGWLTPGSSLGALALREFERSRPQNVELPPCMD